MATKATRVGHLPADGAGRGIQIPGDQVFQSGGKRSPLSSVSTTAVYLNVPKNAISLTVLGSNGNVLYNFSGTFSNTDGNGYNMAPAFLPVEIPCSRQTGIYLRSESGTITSLYFAWNMAR